MAGQGPALNESVPRRDAGRGPRLAVGYSSTRIISPHIYSVFRTQNASAGLIEGRYSERNEEYRSLECADRLLLLYFCVDFCIDEFHPILAYNLLMHLSTTPDR
jgi:hypothetical protein